MKFRKITALLLVLCMLLSLSISVFAAEADEHTIYDSAPDEEPAISTEAATSGTIQNSGIRWSLDEKGWLTISGSGEAPVFQSADDQPLVRGLRQPDHSRAAARADHWQARFLQLPEALYADHVLR